MHVEGSWDEVKSEAGKRKVCRRGHSGWKYRVSLRMHGSENTGQQETGAGVQHGAGVTLGSCSLDILGNFHDLCHSSGPVS